MTFPAIEPVHYFSNETGAIGCSDADIPYTAELTDDPAHVTRPACPALSTPPRHSLTPRAALTPR